MNWQPIVTAPLGQEIILSWNGDVVVGRSVVMKHQKDVLWWNVYCEGDTVDISHNCCQWWMPLPEAPK